METNQNPTFNYNQNPIFDERNEFRQNISSTDIYVLAIVGFVLAFCCGIGMIPSLIAVIIAATKISKVNSNPSMFFGIDNLKNARIVAYISLAINILVILFIFYALITTDLGELERAFEDGFNEGYNEFD